MVRMVAARTPPARLGQLWEFHAEEGNVVFEEMVCRACLPAPQSPMWSYNSLIHQPDNSGNTGDAHGAPWIFRYIISLPSYHQTIPIILPYMSHKYHIISVFISNKFPYAVYTFPFIHMYPIFFPHINCSYFSRECPLPTNFLYLSHTLPIESQWLFQNRPIIVPINFLQRVHYLFYQVRQFSIYVSPKCPPQYHSWLSHHVSHISCS
jgi:hypothetical protein